MLHIEPVKAFRDNYLWVYHQTLDSSATVIDPGDAAPVEAYLRQQNLKLGAILLTHHHADHIGGVAELSARWRVPVYGPYSLKIPQVTMPLKAGDSLFVGGLQLQVLAVPGHTLEHIAYYAAKAAGAPVLFCGDTLFAAGCGRMFEGTPVMMHASLQQLANLPPATRVYCAHEYTLSNLTFAKEVLGEEQALNERIKIEQEKRRQEQPTLPSTIGMENLTNPFLRCADEVVVRALLRRGVQVSDPAAVFGALRRWKDDF